MCVCWLVGWFALIYVLGFLCFLCVNVCVWFVVRLSVGESPKLHKDYQISCMAMGQNLRCFLGDGFHQRV